MWYFFIFMAVFLCGKIIKPCAHYMLTSSPVLHPNSIKIAYFTCQGLDKFVFYSIYSTDTAKSPLCVHMLLVGPSCCSQHTYVIYWRPWFWCCPSPWHITSITRWCTIWSEGSLSSNSTSSTTCWRYYFMIHKVIE